VIYALVFVLAVVAIDLLLEPTASFPDREAFAKWRFRTGLDKFKRQADRAARGFRDLRAKAERAGQAVQKFGEWIVWPADYKIADQWLVWSTENDSYGPPKTRGIRVPRRKGSAMRIDYIDGTEFDLCWWYVDGEYAGRDDQYDMTDFGWRDHMVQVDFAWRTFRSGAADALGEMDFERPDHLADLEPLLNPVSS